MSDGNLELFAKYQAGRGLSTKTIQRRRISIGRFAAVLEPLPIERATGRHVEEWLESIPMASTRRAYRSDLMAFYTWADKRDICPNPVLKTDGIRVPKSLPRPVAASHLEVVLAAAAPDVRLMIALAAYAGLRCAEISATPSVRHRPEQRGTNARRAVREGEQGSHRARPPASR